MVGWALELDCWAQAILRSRGVYTVLTVKALAAAEPGRAKGEGGPLASFFECTDNQNIPSVGHFRSRWHQSFLWTQVMLLQKCGFQNQEMVAVPCMDGS